MGASSPNRKWWSRTSSSWPSAIRLRRAKAIRIGRCSSAPGAGWSMSLRAGLASKAPAKRATPNYGLAASDDRYNPRVLPRRFMDDEAVERFYGLGSPEILAAFEKASARWLKRDRHRAQYGYPFRVAIELALENRHRAVTLASFTCSGAEVTEGLFFDMAAREGASEVPGGKVRAQLDQLSDLICRGPRSQSASYTLPTYA